MIYDVESGMWESENIHDLPISEQNEIRVEVTKALKFFGYEDLRLDKMVKRIMAAELVDATNLLGAYHYILDNEETTARIICGESVDSAIQSQF